MRDRRRLLAVASLAAAVTAASCAGLPDQRARDNAAAHYRLANAALQQPGGFQNERNRRAAYPELEQAIKLDPQNAVYRLTLGTFYLYNQDFPKAEREVQLALKLDPNLAEARNQLGLVYFNQSRLTEAQAQFRKALENLSYPTPEIAAYNLGRVSFQLGDYATAAEAYERSLSVMPNNHDARFELGACYARLGRLPEAERAFAGAVQLRPDFARSRYELGMVLFKLGRQSEAAAQFRKVVELDPAGELGGQARTYLKLLK